MVKNVGALSAQGEHRGIYSAVLDADHEQCQKKIGDEESFSDALRSHHTSQPERFELGATLRKSFV